MPEIVLDPGETTVNKTDETLCPRRAHILVRMWGGQKINE